MVYALINQRIAEVLRSYSLADLLNPKWNETMREQIEGLSPLPTGGSPPVSEGAPEVEGVTS
jgi:hypothetical protein